MERMIERITVCGHVWEGDALSGTWHTQLDGYAVELWFDGVWRWNIGEQYGCLRCCDAPPRGTVQAMETLIRRWASQEL